MSRFASVLKVNVAIDLVKHKQQKNTIQKHKKQNKMSNVRNYIQNARNFANENYTNFSGNQPVYANYTGNQFPANVGYKQANGGGVAQAQPYIIQISNASATAVSNFDVLGAYKYLQSTGFDSNGSLTVNGVTISSGISNISYRDFLWQSTNQPFRVGLTYIQSVSGSAAQITSSFVLDTKDANGNQALRTIVPTISPNQFQTNIVAVEQEYSIDGNTKLTFNSIAASVVINIQFYPAANVNLAAALPNGGGNVAQQYGNPNVVTGIPLKVR